MKRRQAVLELADLWALQHKGGGLVYSGNVPSLYANQKDAWYDGDEDCEPVKVEVEIRELPRKK